MNSTPTKPRSPRRRRLLAFGATAALSTAMIAVSHAPATAAGRPTDFAFNALAYGTKVKAAAGELRSGRTAPAWIGCTRQAGRLKTNEVLAANTPANNPMIHLGTITARSSTFKTRNAVAAGSESVSHVASVTLGLQDQQVPTPSLSFSALTATATAWADRSGDLHASTALDVGAISLVVPPSGTPVDQPLQQLLDLVNGTVEPTMQQVLGLLQANNGAIEIPGLGRLETGQRLTRVNAAQASAKVLALRMTLYGQDGVPGGGDDSAMKIGRSFAQITDDVKVAVMSGSAWSADADLLGGNAHIGDINVQQLPCQGTDGVTRESTLSSGLIPGAMQLGQGTARSNGKITDSGRVRAWTEGAVNHVLIGEGAQSILIDGVIGRINLATDKAGRLVRRDTEGTRGGTLTFNGQTYQLPEPGGEMPELPPELTSLIGLQVGIVDRSDNRALQVTALRVTLLGGSAAGTVVDLGNAKASIRSS